ncbi:hypothetical protein [Pandoraea sp.]|uniref:hypothetical protein n=1 Tax=Pandoraea sp. TaxID=1883445 RepID=UPI0035B11C74
MRFITLRKSATATALTLMLTLAATSAARAATASDALPRAARSQVADMRDMGDLGNMPPPPPGMACHGGPGSVTPATPAFATVRTIEEIAHLYRLGGHSEKVLPFYRETLSKTRDPMLRHHLRDAIARETLKPADTTAAIETLRAQLSEDLAALPSSSSSPPPQPSRPSPDVQHR